MEQSTSNLSAVFRPKVRNALVGSIQLTYDRMMDTYHKCEQQDTEEFQLYAVAMYAIALRNIVAGDSILYASGKIRCHPSICRNEVKKALNEAIKEVYKYDTIVKEALGYHYDQLDTIENMVKEYRSILDEDITYLRNCIYDELHKRRVKLADMLAAIEVVHVIIMLSDMMQQRLYQDNLVFRDRLRSLNYLSLARISAAWEKFLYHTRHLCPSDIDLNALPLCIDAMRHVKDKMNDLKIIAELISK